MRFSVAKVAEEAPEETLQWLPPPLQAGLVCPIEALIVGGPDERLGRILKLTPKCHRVRCADMGVKRAHVSKTFDQLEDALGRAGFGRLTEVPRQDESGYG